MPDEACGKALAIKKNIAIAAGKNRIGGVREAMVSDLLNEPIARAIFRTNPPRGWPTELVEPRESL
jgi:hypothetical protein